MGMGHHRSRGPDFAVESFPSIGGMLRLACKSENLARCVHPKANALLAAVGLDEKRVGKQGSRRRLDQEPTHSKFTCLTVK